MKKTYMYSISKFYIAFWEKVKITSFFCLYKNKINNHLKNTSTVKNNNKKLQLIHFINLQDKTWAFFNVIVA